MAVKLDSVWLKNRGSNRDFDELKLDLKITRVHDLKKLWQGHPYNSPAISPDHMRFFLVHEASSSEMNPDDEENISELLDVRKPLEYYHVKDGSLLLVGKAESTDHKPIPGEKFAYIMPLVSKL